MLEDLGQPVRDLALGVVRATLSTRGYDQARTIMRVNQLLAELTGDYEAFGEWPYFMSIFGHPGDGEPWGWQIDGHHLCINTMVIDGRIVTTPTFMGAEPPGEVRTIRRLSCSTGGRLGLDLIRAFDAAQASGDIPPSIHPTLPSFQKMSTGACRPVSPRQPRGAVQAWRDEMTDAQRRLWASWATYVE